MRYEGRRVFESEFGGRAEIQCWRDNDWREVFRALTYDAHMFLVSCECYDDEQSAIDDIEKRFSIEELYECEYIPMGIDC